MATSIISPSDCEKVLQNYIGNTDFKYISHYLKQYSENAEGFMGEHYRLTIEFDVSGSSKTESFFLKTVSTKSKAREEAATSTGVFKKEIFFYNFLMKEFEKCEFDTSFAAACYYCIPDRTLVMEDMTNKGFKSPERNENYSLHEMKCLLRSLALFHAASFAYERSQSGKLNKTFHLDEEHGQYLEEIFCPIYTNPKALANVWFKSTLSAAEELIDLLPEDTIKFKEYFKKFELGKIFAEDTKMFKTCGHGDLWSNNMLFKYENNAPISCCLVDFQVIRYFSPALDVMMSLFMNSNVEFRLQHLSDMYQYYYDTLINTSKKYSYPLEKYFSKTDFLQSCDAVKTDVLYQILCVKMVICVPAEILTEYVKNTVNDSNNDSFKKQSLLTVEAFKSDNKYREIITEIFCELRDCLLNK